MTMIKPLIANTKTNRLAFIVWRRNLLSGTREPRKREYVDQKIKDLISRAVRAASQEPDWDDDQFERICFLTLARARTVARKWGTDATTEDEMAGVIIMAVNLRIPRILERGGRPSSCNDTRVERVITTDRYEDARCVETIIR